MIKTWIDKSTKIRKGEELDRAKLEVYLRKNLPHFKGELLIKQFPQGYSNLTYLIFSEDFEYVLRRPPFGANIKSAHDMGREFKILKALFEIYPKVPKPLLYESDESIIGSPFYIMERVTGIILRAKMPPGMIPGPEKMFEIAHGLVETFAELHEVDFKRAGLGDLGRPEGYVQRQIAGWTNRYIKSKTDDIAAIELVAKWLSEHMPNASGVSLIHNDFKYDNLVLDPEDGSSVKSILDWEMSTIGDPLMDLGTSLGYWITENDPHWIQELSLSPTSLPGNPSRGELVEMYAKISGKDIRDIIFYYVYGIFKIAVISQQIYYRYKHGFTKDMRFAKLKMVVQGLGNMAARAIELKRIDDLF